MFGRLTARTSGVLCALVLSSLPAFGSDAIGLLHPTCGFPYGYLLEITSYRGQRLPEPIRFQVMGEPALQSYLGQWDAPPSNDDAKFRRIQVLHVSHHWGRAMEMTGNFVIEFEDGRKMEGSFRAKLVKPPEVLICE